MNFSSHTREQIVAFELGLSGNKNEILESLLQSAKTARELLKEDAFDWWIEQIQQVDQSEVPMTKIGIAWSKMLIGNLKTKVVTRQELKACILTCCKNLLTYFDEDDLCPGQTEYHHYFHTTLNQLFRCSDLGFSDLPEFHQEPSPSEIRIAFLSELNTDQELLAE